MFTSRRITGAEAAAIGLVDRACPEDELDDVVEALAREIAENSPGTNRIDKALLRDAARMGRREATEASRLLTHIQSQHINEPGVGRQLTELLIEIGVLNPDGTPAAPAEEPADGGRGPRGIEGAARDQQDGQRSQAQGEEERQAQSPGAEAEPEREPRERSQ